MYEKYTDALPLYRQEKGFELLGIRIRRTAMASWIITCSQNYLKGINEGSYVMVDGYSGYNRLKKIHRCCCYAHIRRYLIEAIPNGHEKDYSHLAIQGALYCNKLFEYERSYKAKELSYAQVYKRRQKDANPVVEGFMRWLEECNQKSE